MMNAGRSWTRPSVLLALATLVLHAIANGHYGFFRDELYFIVCGDRPAWGYVDQPPIVPLLASWSHLIFGDFLWGFRLPAALVMAATVGLTAELVRSEQGDTFAQWLAGVCVLLAPIFLFQGVVLSTDLFQPVTWLGLGWILVRMEKTGDDRWWLGYGIVAGFSLNTKYLIAFYIVALAIALLATPMRKAFLRPWVYLGAAVAIMMMLPNLLWQQAHGWPFIELAHAGAAGKNIAMSPPAFFLQQIIQIGPLTAAVWLCGLWAGAVRPTLQVNRAFSIAWLILFLMFDVSHGKAYYLSPIYPTLLAVGAVRMEEWVRNGLARAAVLTCIIVQGFAFAPLTLPILAVEVFKHYENRLGFMPSAGEHQKLGLLPQYYADMFGWPEMAEKVAAVYWSLPPRERARAVFFGNNYGEAAAIDVFGRRLGLPPAISGHNNYYLWGPRGRDGSIIIIIGGNQKHYRELFGSFRVAGKIQSINAMPYETNQPIYVLRDMKPPLQDFWPQVKNYQ
jgi:Dolichyl-phosphate-mannose-protein mannosyltransferase